MEWVHRGVRLFTVFLFILLGCLDILCIESSWLTLFHSLFPLRISCQPSCQPLVPIPEFPAPTLCPGGEDTHTLINHSMCAAECRGSLMLPYPTSECLLDDGFPWPTSRLTIWALPLWVYYGHTASGCWGKVERWEAVCQCSYWSSREAHHFIHT